MIRNKKALKTIAIFLLLNMLNFTLTPYLLMADLGPNAKEYSSFVSAASKEMVDLQTGNFKYNVPLLDLPGPDGSYPINAFYESGIKYTQDASWIGLGWNLNVGSITRSVNEVPDDYNGAQITVANTYSAGVQDLGGTLIMKPWEMSWGVGVNDDGSKFKIPLGYINPYLPAISNATTNYYGVLHGYESTQGTNVTDSRQFDCQSFGEIPFTQTYLDPISGLAGSLPAKDQYTVSSQGLNGTIEPVLLSNGSMFRQKHAIDGMQAGFSNDDYSILKAWPQGKPKFRFKNDFTNSLVTSPTDITPNVNGNTLSLGSNGLGYSYTGPDDAGFNPAAMQLSGSNDVTYFTNNEVYNGTAKTKGFIDYQGIALSDRNHLSFTIAASTGTNYGFDVSGQIAGFSITDENGVTYHYALPVYSYGFKTEMNAPAGIVGRTKRVVDNSQAYATSWLLTTITGPDFVDSNTNGIADEADGGAWTNFNYGRWSSNYTFRSPFTGYDVSKDGSTVYSGGYKEVYYLDAAYTRSHTALFGKMARFDNMGANSRDAGGIIGGYSESSMMLDNVYLLRNEDLLTYSATSTNSFSKDIYSSIQEIKKLSTQNSSQSTKYQTVLDGSDLMGSSFAGYVQKAVNFTFDYSLCPNANNSTYSSGKLTLNKIQLFGKNSTRIAPSIDFQYDLPNPKTCSAQITHYPYFPNSGYFTKDRLGRIDMGSTPNSFQVGDIIKMTISGTTYYCTLIDAIPYYPAPLYDVIFLGSNMPGSAQWGIAVTATQTKNPPYTDQFFDNWGYFKSDYKADNGGGPGGGVLPYSATSGKENFDRRANSMSSQSVDAWSLQKITTSLGSTIEVQYESDTYFNNKLNPKTVMNLSRGFGYTRTDGTFTWDNAPNVDCVFNYEGLNRDGWFRFGVREPINYSEEFYAGQIIRITTAGTFSASKTSSSDPDDYTNLPKSIAGTDLFQITSVGTTYFQGKYITDPNSSGKSNPLYNNYVVSGINKTFNHNGSFITYESNKKYGGGVRTKKITTKEGNGDFYETTYDYTNKVTTYSSGLTATEPGSFMTLSDLSGSNTCGNWAYITDVVDQSSTSPYYGRGHISYWDADILNRYYQSTVFKLSFAFNYSNPEVIYEYVTKKEYGNGIPTARYDEFRFQTFSDDMLKKDVLSHPPSVGGSYAPMGSQTIKISDYTSQVGNLIHHKVYDNSNNLIQEENYSYSTGNSTQGRIEEVYHENRIHSGGLNYSPYGQCGLVTVKNYLPTVLSYVEAKDYVKGTYKRIDNEVYDFYSGKVTRKTTHDSYNNQIVSVDMPAYQIYTSKTSTGEEMGPKVNNGFNRNMLSQNAASYVYKDIAGTTSIAGTMSYATSYVSSTTSNSMYYTKYKMTLTSPATLSSRYVTNSLITLNVTVMGNPSTITPTIAYIYPDKTAFEFYYTNPYMNVGSCSINSQNCSLISSSINAWSKNWNYRTFNSTSGYYENLAITDGTVTNPYEYQQIWRPTYSYNWICPYLNNDGTYKSTGTGAYQEFDWSRELALAKQVSAYWQKGSIPTLKDRYSNTLEVKDSLNSNYNAVKITYDQTFAMSPPTGTTFTYTSPIFNGYIHSSGKNTNYASFGFSSFEETSTPYAGQNDFAGEITSTATLTGRYAGTSTIIPHSGNYVLKIPAGSSSITTFKARYVTTTPIQKEGNIIRGKKYRASVWAHKSCDDAAQLFVTVKWNNGASTTTGSFTKFTSTVKVGDWYLLTLDFDVPSNFDCTGSQDNVEVKLANSTGADSYFDDFAVRPIDAIMTSNVYDPVTKQITYQIDNDNFYTRYQYDNTRRLIATYKETLKGEKKVSDHQYNFAKP